MKTFKKILLNDSLEINEAKNKEFTNEKEWRAALEKIHGKNNILYMAAIDAVSNVAAYYSKGGGFMNHKAQLGYWIENKKMGVIFKNK